MDDKLPADPARRRLIALGAGTLLAPFGGAPLFVRHARAADVDRFALGVASGCPQADGVVLWTRLVGDDLPAHVPVAWELADDERFTAIAARGSADAVAEDAHSVHVQLAGLDPARWYFYRFTALGARSRTGRTRTAPASGAAAASLQFAIASCQRWDHGQYAAWRDMADDGALDLVFFLGDYIYESRPASPFAGRVRQHEGDGAATTLDQYRARHAQYKSDPALQRMHASAPWIMVWDDHEVENDYAGLQSQSLAPDFALRRAAAYRAYWEHQPFPPSARPVDGSMRIFGRTDWGRLARILALDGRQYRAPQACPRPGRGGGNVVRWAECPELADGARSLLGTAQEQWLAEGWSAQHGWNLVAQQTLMSRFVSHDSARFDAADPAGDRIWTDGWDGYPDARARLLAGAQQRGARNLTVLGGDRHTHFVADLQLDPADRDSPVIGAEFCGTSISSEGPAQSRTAAMMAFNPHIRYARSDQRGYMRFSLDADALQAQLRVVDDPLDANSAVRTAARYVAEAGRPGVRQA